MWAKVMSMVHIKKPGEKPLLGDPFIVSGGRRSIFFRADVTTFKQHWATIGDRKVAEPTVDFSGWCSRFRSYIRNDAAQERRNSTRVHVGSFNTACSNISCILHVTTSSGYDSYESTGNVAKAPHAVQRPKLAKHSGAQASIKLESLPTLAHS